MLNVASWLDVGWKEHYQFIIWDRERGRKLERERELQDVWRTRPTKVTNNFPLWKRHFFQGTYIFYPSISVYHFLLSLFLSINIIYAENLQ